MDVEVPDPLELAVWDELPVAEALDVAELVLV